jgi:hypothetical protein
MKSKEVEKKKVNLLFVRLNLFLGISQIIVYFVIRVFLGVFLRELVYKCSVIQCFFKSMIPYPGVHMKSHIIGKGFHFLMKIRVYQRIILFCIFEMNGQCACISVRFYIRTMKWCNSYTNIEPLLNSIPIKLERVFLSH